jgi:hypothetical protein
MKWLVLTMLVCLSACSWLGLRRSPALPQPTEIVITGAPAGSRIFIDGSQVGELVARNDTSQILDVAPGAHKVEIHVNDAIVYREDTYAGAGERRVVSVLSGSSR